jgi:hypothetical protein
MWFSLYQNTCTHSLDVHNKVIHCSDIVKWPIVYRVNWIYASPILASWKNAITKNLTWRYATTTISYLCRCHVLQYQITHFAYTFHTWLNMKNFTCSSPSIYWLTWFRPQLRSNGPVRYTPMAQICNNYWRRVARWWARGEGRSWRLPLLEECAAGGGRGWRQSLQVKCAGAGGDYVAASAAGAAGQECHGWRSISGSRCCWSRVPWLEEHLRWDCQSKSTVATKLPRPSPCWVWGFAIEGLHQWRKYVLEVK